MADAPFLIGLESTELTDADRSRIVRLCPVGYLLLERNVDCPGQLRSLTDSLRDLHEGLDPIIAIEEESGPCSHLSRLVHPTPPPAVLATREKARGIAEHGAATGVLLSLLGINLNLAPVLDLKLDPDDQAEPRRWHRDNQTVIDQAGMWNRWLRRQKVCCGAKHFPAGGRAPGSPVGLEELLKEDLIPYTALMSELDAIVVGHQQLPTLDPERPASLSSRIVTRLLRDQLGFDRHLVLAEDPSTAPIAPEFTKDEFIPHALGAGNDLVIVARDLDDLEQAASRTHQVPAPLRHDSEVRIERFRKKLPAPLPWSDKRWAKATDMLLHA